MLTDRHYDYNTPLWTKKTSIPFCEVCRLDALQECPCVYIFTSQGTPGCNQYYAGHILPLECQGVLLHTVIDWIPSSTLFDDMTPTVQFLNTVYSNIVYVKYRFSILKVEIQLRMGWVQSWVCWRATTKKVKLHFRYKLFLPICCPSVLPNTLESYSYAPT